QGLALHNRRMSCQSQSEKLANKPGFEKVRQGINTLSDFVCIGLVSIHFPHPPLSQSVFAEFCEPK
ncbi:hypothetical protein QUB75_30975, partial [Microcoleus sp. K1-B6]|uniref:hypothetical protein n=1 Tax=unclassified Microcoleus TaxID=2642155 RepID=UPI002FD08845